MLDSTVVTKRAYSRRKVLAFSAAGMATAALAACGEAGGVPTATEVPRTLTAGTAAPAATGAAPAASAAAAATPSAAMAAAPMTVPAANLAATQTFRWADANPPDGIDPAIITSPYVASQMFEGVIVVSTKDGTFEPGMAESYTSNADATVWTFKMRPGVTWSDGTPITAKDFEYSFRRVMDPATKSKYTSAFYGIKNGKEVETGKVTPDQLGVKAVDDKTFEVTLTEATPFFPLIAGTWTCLPTPQHIISKLGDKWTLGPNVVSNGPYVLTEWKQDQSFTLLRNEKYWGPKPTITRVEQKIYDDPLAKSLMAYESNEIDQAQVSAGDYDRVRGDAKLKGEIKPFEGSSSYFLVLDCTNTPTDNVKVRQALSLGFDRKTLIDTVLKGYYTDAQTMLPDNIPGFNPKAALTGGVDKAKQLMTEAGFPNGQNWPAEFALIYSSASAATFKPALEFLQAEWKKNLGINVQVQAMESKAASAFRVERKMGKKFNGAMGNWGSDYADPSNWHNQLFISKSDYYGSHYKNDQFDSIAAKALATTNKDERVKMYEQAEQIFVQDTSHLTLYHGRSFYVVKPNVQGIVHPPILGTTPWFKYISITK